MHQIEALVDFLKRQHMGNHRVDLDLAGHVPIDDLGHVGPPFGAAERGSAPVAAGDELERAGRDFLARLGHTDDDRGAPAAMAGFKCLPHHRGIASAIKGIIGPAIGQRDQMRNDIALNILGIDEMRHPEPLAPFLARRVDINADNHVRSRHPRTLQHVEADSAQPEHDDIVTGAHFCRVDHGANACRHPAADVAAGVERRVFADLGDRDFRQNREVGEG